MLHTQTLSSSMPTHAHSHSALCPQATVTMPVSQCLGALASGTVNTVSRRQVTWSVWISYLQVSLHRNAPNVSGMQLCIIFLKPGILRVWHRRIEVISEWSCTYLSTGLFFYSSELKVSLCRGSGVNLHFSIIHYYILWEKVHVLGLSQNGYFQRSLMIFGESDFFLSLI